jgi:hypothetical protein
MNVGTKVHNGIDLANNSDLNILLEVIYMIMYVSSVNKIKSFQIPYVDSEENYSLHQSVFL